MWDKTRTSLFWGWTVTRRVGPHRNGDEWLAAGVAELDERALVASTDGLELSHARKHPWRTGVQTGSLLRSGDAGEFTKRCEIQASLAKAEEQRSPPPDYLTEEPLHISERQIIPADKMAH
jgi:hypothetical protein